MGPVSLDHDRVARAKGAGGVTTSHRKGKRKVAAAKDHDRPQRPLQPPQVGPRQWLTIGQRPLNPGIDPRALTGSSRKHFQLVDGATTFTSEAGRRQCRL